MFYLVVYLILSSALCIFSSESWETFVDRLDLLIRDSYLIIQCNENEVQIVNRVATYDELEANVECTNKEKLLEHSSDKVQLIDFTKIFAECPNEEVLFITYFSRIEASLDKDENGVDWPFIRTRYMKGIPVELNFLNKPEMSLKLAEIKKNKLRSLIKTFFINIEFVNRPMRCRIQLNDLYMPPDRSCNTQLMKTLFEPVCYYKVGGENPPSIAELNKIRRKVLSYTQKSTNNYIYVSNINNFDGSTDNDGDTNSETESPETDENKETVEDASQSGTNTKFNKLMIIIVVFLVICSISFILGFIFYRKIYLKRKDDDQLSSSYENRMSTSSDPVHSETNRPSLPAHRSRKEKRKTVRQGAKSWFKVDDDI